MRVLEPQDGKELAEALREAASAGRSIAVGGNFSKQAMGGPLAPADVTISTRRLNRLLAYDPRDLTISVEAGMTFSQLSQILREHGQMAPLDPCFGEQTTVGGLLATNLSGPRRRLYGTARDMLIGMRVATLEGKLVESGGMVVKNVAGLDIARLMIGSFGTLAVIVSANFRVFPIPFEWRTWRRTFTSLQEALEARDAVLRGALQPAALDLLNPAAAERLGASGYCLVLEAGGSRAVMDRYARELPGWDLVDAAASRAFWCAVREFAPDYLREFPGGAVARVAATLTGIGEVLATVNTPALARAGSGAIWICFPDCDAAMSWLEKARRSGWRAVIEMAPPERKEAMELWPQPGPDFSLMLRLKQMFDPQHLLNRGRLYGRI